MNRKNKNKKGKTKPGFWTRAKIVVFAAVMTAGFLLAMLIPLRPAVSQSENRKLSAFPAFSVRSLFDGSYFMGINLWFSDTFPFRETLVTANGSLKKLYGFTAAVIHGSVGKGDEIPDAPVTRREGITETATQAPTQPPVATTQEPATAAPDLGETQTFGAVLLIGDSAYEYYSFVTDLANQYIAAVNKTADKLAGKATVYNLVVPNSMGILLPDSMRKEIQSSDQKKAIGYIYGSMDKKVKTADVYSSLEKHKSEYIYFRTDHHWTAVGAYYGYTAFAQAKGVDAVPLNKYEKKAFKNFLGSFYASAKKDPALGKHPDTVEAFEPFNDTAMTFTDKRGNTVKWEVITDVEKWSPSSKYSAFIGGDNPYANIRNNDLTDNSSCLVIKESYGNAFVPFLIPHYQTVHVIDYRYWKGDLIKFVTDKKIKDVLIVNNISATRNTALIEKLRVMTGA